MLKGTLDHGFNLAQIEGLHQIIERAQTQRFNRALDGLHAANHYDHGVGRDLFYVRDHLQPTHPRHGDVADYQPKFVFAQTHERFFS